MATRQTKTDKRIPFQFVLDELANHNPFVRPMFGCHAIYLDGKMVLILRKKENHVDDNGVWVATTNEHHASLKSEFPSLRKVNLLGQHETAWQNLPEESADFEESVFRICALIRKNDKRIGKFPKKKKSKKQP